MNSQWPTGVPPQMGGHLMASGDYAPVSTSTTCGTGAVHIFQYYEDDMTNTDVKVRACGLASHLSSLTALPPRRRVRYERGTSRGLPTLSETPHTTHATHAAENRTRRMCPAQRPTVTKCTRPSQRRGCTPAPRVHLHLHLYTHVLFFAGGWQLTHGDLNPEVELTR
jgi:hypothetical protein